MSLLFDSFDALVLEKRKIFDLVAFLLLMLIWKKIQIEIYDILLV